jgi:hypothetical protein
VVQWLALQTTITEVPGSIPGHYLGFFWGSWVWNGVHSASWSDKLSSYLNKEVTVRFRKLKNAAVRFDVLTRAIAPRIILYIVIMGTHVLLPAILLARVTGRGTSVSGIPSQPSKMENPPRWHHQQGRRQDTPPTQQAISGRKFWRHWCYTQ